MFLEDFKNKLSSKSFAHHEYLINFSPSLGIKRISNGSITSRSSLVEDSSHRIHNDDGGGKNAEHLILLNQTTSSNVSLIRYSFLYPCMNTNINIPILFDFCVCQ